MEEIQNELEERSVQNKQSATARAGDPDLDDELSIPLSELYLQNSGYTLYSETAEAKIFRKNEDMVVPHFTAETTIDENMTLESIPTQNISFVLEAVVVKSTGKISKYKKYTSDLQLLHEREPSTGRFVNKYKLGTFEGEVRRD